jgi:hypothetical protein
MKKATQPHGNALYDENLRFFRFLPRRQVTRNGPGNRHPYLTSRDYKDNAILRFVLGDR